ncbi:hypothetical protein TNCV_1606391 [Trichonephila clavipes]|nr:hypothetical protein TNCV_1606391 [Trichonephila clavipes]
MRESFIQFLIHKLHLNVGAWWKVIVMPRSITARIGKDPIIVSRTWNGWVQDGIMECRAGSQRLPITSNREDRHVSIMALMDRTATPRATSPESRMGVV